MSSSMRVADRYTLDREIGRGGSGAVWLAHDEVLGRPVAIKRIGLPPGASTYDVSRAEREARISAQVNHANVVAVFDFVNDGDHTWLVTEYVEGTTLAQLIRDRGRLSPDEAAPLLVQVADALAAAHRLAIVHRDVKPSNILIGLDGTAKLTDFGIARAVADASLTQTGLVTGSPAYIAPEIATGAAATTASDVWSFGATIFHTLTGRPPYEAEDSENAVLGVLYRVAHEPPPRLNGGGWLAPLLEATMNPEPDGRLTMEEVTSILHAGPPATASLETQALPLPTAEPKTEPESEPGTEPESEPEARTETETGTDAETGADAETGVVVAAEPAPEPEPEPEPVPGSADDDPAVSTAVAAPAVRRRSSARRLALAGAAAAAVALIAIGAVLLAGSGDDPDDEAAALPNTTTSADSGSGTGAGGTGAAPSAEELESFASSYVTTAADDPAAGFAMLTPAYQDRSAEYDAFWGPANNPEILEVEADPEELTVTYTYKYDFPGDGNQTETVTLFLVREGDRLLIDDAVTG